MLDKETLIKVLTEVSLRAQTDEISKIIKDATGDFNVRLLMQTMMDLHKKVLEEMGYDGMDGLMDCMEAIDRFIDDDEVMGLVMNIRSFFGQE